MADYVGQTADGLTGLSKGCRRQGISSDLMMARTDGVSSFSFSHTPASPSGWQINMNSASSSTSVQYRLTAFCTNFVERGVLLTSRSRLTVDDAIQADGGSTTIGTNASDQSGYYRLVSDLALGEYKIGVNNVSGQAGNHICYDIATPIHTSSHYQEFESPTLKELIGGDRNMEQTNLVVTAEGKTWDEITRDTSYIGKGRVSCHFVGSSPSVDALVYMDDWRGLTTGTEYYNKDFAISYDRIICLVPGNYTIVAQSMMSVPNTGSNHVGIFINGAQRMQGHTGTHSYSTTTPMAVVDLNWGDYVQVKGRYRAEQSRAGFYIERN